MGDGRYLVSAVVLKSNQESLRFLALRCSLAILRSRTKYKRRYTGKLRVWITHGRIVPGTIILKKLNHSSHHYSKRAPKTVQNQTKLWHTLSSQCMVETPYRQP